MKAIVKSVIMVKPEVYRSSMRSHFLRSYFCYLFVVIKHLLSTFRAPLLFISGLCLLYREFIWVFYLNDIDLYYFIVYNSSWVKSLSGKNTSNLSRETVRIFKVNTYVIAFFIALTF